MRFIPTVRTKYLDAITHTFFSTIDALLGDFDIIHYHGVGPSLLSWLPRLLKPRVKVVATLQCLDRFHSKWGLFARLMLRLGEWCACHFPHQTIVVSRSLANYAKEKYGRETTLIPNGAKTPPLEPSDNQALEQFGLKKNQYLIAVSRLIPHKAIHILIEAFCQFKKDRPVLAGNLKLAVVGDSSYTDRYVAYLRKIAGDCPEIIFTGWQSGQALAELVTNALIFVHPSKSEGQPMAVLEAMGYGRPLIASDIPEHQEILPDRRFLFRAGQTTDLEKKLIWILENPEMLKVAGLQNRQIAEKDYNWDNIAAQIEILYKKLLIPQAANLPSFAIKRMTA